MTPRKQDRTEFEAWARTFATWDVERDDDKALGTTGYTDVTLAIAWAAWQAGRRTQTVPPGGKLVPVAVPAAVTPNGLRPYICPTRTVADLVNNLLLLDQALPIHGAQHIEIEGRRRARAVQPIVSHERVKEGRWIGEGEELNAVVIWTRAEQPAAVSVTGAEFSQLLADVMTAAGLIEHGKQCKALAARLGDMVMRLRVEPPPKADHFRDATQMVPQGWQLVPVEPTDGMRATFEAQKGTATFFTNTMNYIGDFVERYRAMLAAAPQPPVDHLRDATEMIGHAHAIERAHGIT